MNWFVSEFAKQELVVSNEKSTIPKQVLQQLKCFYKGFHIANPDEKHQEDCNATAGLPALHISLLAKNENYLVLMYHTYSLGSSSRHIWIHFDTTGIIDYWSASTMGIFMIEEDFTLQKYCNAVSKQVTVFQKFLKQLSKPE
jgi:hypothetical protein